jgi:small-conductance mechanosensitive channel
MDDITELAASLWIFLNYPLIKVGTTAITIWTILFNVALVAGFVVISAKIKNWLLKSVSSRPGVNHSNWRATITLAYYGVILIGLIGILQTTGLDLSIFTVLTGAIGLGIGFGMQTIFSNFVSGIIILLEKPLRLGDRIQVGDVSGNVHNISVRATTIVTNDNVSIIVPNSDFISKQVINWSASGHRVRISISMSVAYDSDPDLVKKLLLEVAQNESGVLDTPEPTVRLSEFGENGLKFSLLVWTHDFADRMGALKSLLNFGVLRAFRENNIRIPYPQREIHVINDDLHKETL